MFGAKYIFAFLVGFALAATEDAANLPVESGSAVVASSMSCGAENRTVVTVFLEQVNAKYGAKLPVEKSTTEVECLPYEIPPENSTVPDLFLNHNVDFFFLIFVSDLLGGAEDSLVSSKYLKNVNLLSGYGRASHPRFSDDGKYVVFSHYVFSQYRKQCPSILRASSNVTGRRSWDEPSDQLTRLSPGFGLAYNPSFAGPNNNHVIFESNIHKGPLKDNFYQDSWWDKVYDGSVYFPCDDIFLCRRTVRNDNETVAGLCEDPYYEIPSSMALYAANEYGNLIAQLTGPNIEPKELKYSGDAAVSPDKETVIYSGRCDAGMCLYAFYYQPDDLKKDDAKRPQAFPLNVTSLNEPNAAYGGVSFSSDGDTIVFHGYTPQPNNDTALQIFRARLDHGLFPTKSTELYIGHVHDHSFTKINTSPPNVVQKLYPKIVPKTDNKKILYTAKLEITNEDGNSFTGEGYQLRMYDIESGTDIAITSIGMDTGQVFDASFNSDGSKLVFTASWPDMLLDYNAYVGIADFDLSGGNTAPVLAQIPEKPSQQENSQEILEKKAMELDDVVPYDGVVHFQNEKYFKNVRQLTFGGVNRKGYFNLDETKIAIEAFGEPYGSTCNQIYEISLNSDRPMRRLSSGFGWTTIGPYDDSYSDNNDWEQDKKRDKQTYASDLFNVVPDAIAVRPILCRPKLCDPLNLKTINNQDLSDSCLLPTQELLKDSKIFATNKEGLITSVFNQYWPYAGEPYFGSRRQYFTAISNGTSEAQGPNIFYKLSWSNGYTQITKGVGYKGGAAYNGDYKNPSLAFHANFPKDLGDQNRFQKLYKNMLIDPSKTEIYVADLRNEAAVISYNVIPNITQLTNFGCASWGPVFLKDSFQILFSTDKNYCGKQKPRGSKDPEGNEWWDGSADLFVVASDGTGLEQITFSGSKIFDGDATLNFNGTRIIWASTRNATKPGELNLFTADWLYPARINSVTATSTEPWFIEASTVTQAASFARVSAILNMIFLFVVIKTVIGCI
ncbi:hypothetical protein DdX_13007 [Ditylenchus destructor]|uniref:Uncharacterized protein n=1 Tax=Ditylenchus destructor TaxID=166010 RepID=A0AAD4MZS0_9BILA|nr:hypothetical protein DdX_13007 [Ditylenchus destructor]